MYEYDFNRPDIYKLTKFLKIVFHSHDTRHVLELESSIHALLFPSAAHDSAKGAEIKTNRDQCRYLYQDYVSSEEELFSILIQLERIVNSADKDKEFALDILDQLGFDDSGSFQRLSLRDRLKYGTTKEMVIDKIKLTRVNSKQLIRDIRYLFDEKDELHRDVYLLQSFILDQFSFFKKYCIKSKVFVYHDLLPEEVHPIMWCVAWLAVWGSFGFMLYFIFAWAVYNGSTCFASWGMNYWVGAIQDIMFIQLVKVYIVQMVGLEASKPQMANIQKVISSKLYSIASSNVPSHGSCPPSQSTDIQLIQILSPACRAAKTRACKEYISSLILNSLTDEDAKKCRKGRHIPVGQMSILLVALPISLALINDVLSDVFLDVAIPSILAGFILANNFIYQISVMLLVVLYACIVGAVLAYFFLSKSWRDRCRLPSTLRSLNGVNPPVPAHNAEGNSYNSSTKVEHGGSLIEAINLSFEPRTAHRALVQQELRISDIEGQNEFMEYIHEINPRSGECHIELIHVNTPQLSMAAFEAELHVSVQVWHHICFVPDRPQALSCIFDVANSASLQAVYSAVLSHYLTIPCDYTRYSDASLGLQRFGIEVAKFNDEIDADRLLNSFESIWLAHGCRYRDLFDSLYAELRVLLTSTPHGPAAGDHTRPTRSIRQFQQFRHWWNTRLIQMSLEMSNYAVCYQSRLNSLSHFEEVSRDTSVKLLEASLRFFITCRLQCLRAQPLVEIHASFMQSCVHAANLLTVIRSKEFNSFVKQSQSVESTTGLSPPQRSRSGHAQQPVMWLFFESMEVIPTSLSLFREFSLSTESLAMMLPTLWKSFGPNYRIIRGKTAELIQLEFTQWVACQDVSIPVNYFHFYKWLEKIVSLIEEDYFT